jgi:CRP/FNR family transcriptional regulator, cyclic AMP receptor protein
MAATDAIGYLAASLVLVTFCMRSMRSLRCVAIASNLAFIGYGYCNDLMPVLFLHLLLLPVNIRRLVQLGGATGPGRAGPHGIWQRSEVSQGGGRQW